jgi:hypothetical protein
MELQTTIVRIGDSVYVRIPANMVEYYKIKKNRLPAKCRIKDDDDETAKITFRERKNKEE